MFKYSFVIFLFCFICLLPESGYAQQDKPQAGKQGAASSKVGDPQLVIPLEPKEQLEQDLKYLTHGKSISEVQKRKLRRRIQRANFKAFSLNPKLIKEGTRKRQALGLIKLGPTEKQMDAEKQRVAALEAQAEAEKQRAMYREQLNQYESIQSYRAQRGLGRNVSSGSMSVDANGNAVFDAGGGGAFVDQNGNIGFFLW